jgi:hypothetical protein
MNEKFYDPIIAEVRKNREDLFAEHDSDINKLIAYIVSERPKKKAAGVHYETEEERQARFTWSLLQQEGTDG